MFTPFISSVLINYIVDLIDDFFKHRILFSEKFSIFLRMSIRENLARKFYQEKSKKF